MKANNLTKNDFLNTQITLWEHPSEDAKKLANYIKNNPANIYGFGRYLWNEISSGQMPPELAPSFNGDLIIFSQETISSLPSGKLIQSLTLEQIDAELQTVQNCEPDFNGAIYLIIDQDDKLHFLPHCYEFNDSIKSCFFIPSKQLSAELHERANDKENIKIDTGAKLRC